MKTSLKSARSIVIDSTKPLAKAVILLCPKWADELRTTNGKPVWASTAANGRATYLVWVALKLVNNSSKIAAEIEELQNLIYKIEEEAVTASTSDHEGYMGEATDDYLEELNDRLIKLNLKDSKLDAKWDSLMDFLDQLHAYACSGEIPPIRYHCGPKKSIYNPLTEEHEDGSSWVDLTSENIILAVDTMASWIRSNIFSE